MEFRILGPLQVHGEDGRPCLLEPRQARLLAALLLAANQVVTRQHLVDAVWSDDPPATAARQLRNLVSALRRRLAEAGASAPVIIADGPGYRVQVADTQLDAQVFASHLTRAQDLLSSGQVTDAARTLRAGLALWRGPALVGPAARPGPPIDAGAVRLDEQRMAALEQCLDLELHLGRHHELVGELTELVAAHPLRERLVGQLMLALYRCGRQADALAAYYRLRARLADDLGIDPAPALRDVHTAILRNDPEAFGSAQPADAAGSTKPVPRQLPVPVRHFVGRTAELKDLTRLASETRQDAPVVISAISGTGGIGKTALALHWAHRISDRFPDGQLHLNLRGFDPAGSPMTPAEAIRNLLDALQVPPERIPASLDAQAGLYRSVIAGRRMLVVLDNARDSDQVRPLLPGTPGCLVLVTSRNQLSGLHVAEGAYPINLDLLTTGEARDLLTRHLGPERLAAEADAADELVGHCAGLPLALAIVAARATAYPAFPLAGLAAELTGTDPLVHLDTGEHSTRLRAVFSWSYRQVTPAAAGLFRLLGLHLGPDISVAAAASLAGVAPARVRPSLAELTRANLVTERVPGRYTCHDLLRAYAAELTGNSDHERKRRAALRRLLDHYLHTAYRAARVLHPLRQRFVPAEPHPGVAPEELTDDRQALGWFIAEHQVLLAAVRLAVESGYDRHAYQLAWCLTDYLDWRGHWHDWATAQEFALRAARRLKDLTAQAHAHRGMAGAHFRRGDYDAAHRQLSHALDLLDPRTAPADRAQVHLNLAAVCGRQGRHGEALDHAHHALDLARGGGDRVGEGEALHCAGWAYALLGDHRQALRYGRQALTVAEQLGDRENQAATWGSLGEAYQQLGDHARAIACHQKSLALWRALSNRYYEANRLVQLGDAHRSAGDRASARHAWQDALEILDELGHPEAEQVRGKLSAPSPP